MGTLSQKHRDNRSDHHERRKQARAFFHTIRHGTDAARRKLAANLREEHGLAQPIRPGPPESPVVTHWPTDRERLSAYNRENSFHWWPPIGIMT